MFLDLELAILFPELTVHAHLKNDITEHAKWFGVSKGRKL